MDTSQETLVAQDPERVYDEVYGINYGNIINGSPDYTGCGLFPEEEEATDPSGFKYKFGKSKDPVEPFILRDNKMLQLITANMPADKKLRALELGSGRGGLTRFLAQELIKSDKLEVIVATNLSPTENNYNMQMAREAGIPDEKLQIIKKSFDEMDDYEDGSYDLIFSNDAMIHTADPKKLMQEIHRLLSKDGIVVFSDIVEGPTATREQLADLYDRYQLINMGSKKVYDETLMACGMTRILCEMDGGEAIWRHFGL